MSDNTISKKNVFAAAVLTTAIMSSESPQAAELGDVTWVSATNTAENFTPLVSNPQTGVDYRSSTSAAVDISLKRGTGTGGTAAGDTYDNAVNHLTGASYGTAYSKIEGDNDPNILVIPEGGRGIAYPVGSGDEIIAENNTRAVVDFKNYSGAMVVDTTKGIASHGIHFSNIDKFIGSATSNTTFIANGSQLELQGQAKTDRYTLAKNGTVSIYESSAGTEPDTVNFPKGLSPNEITISGNEITYTTDASNSGKVVFDDINRIENFQLDGFGYPTMTLQQLKRAVETSKMGAPVSYNETKVCVGNTAAQTFTTASGVTCNTVDYTTSPSPVKVSLGSDAALGTGTRGTAEGDRFGTIVTRVIGSSSTDNTTYNELSGNTSPNIFYGIGQKNLVLMGAQDVVVGNECIKSGSTNWVDYRGGTTPVYLNRIDNVGLGGNAEGTAAFCIDAIKLPTTADTVVTKYGENITIQDQGGFDTYYIAQGSQTILNDASGANIVVFDENLSPLTALVAGNTISFNSLTGAANTSVTFKDITDFGVFRFKSQEKNNQVYHSYQDLIDMVDKGIEAGYSATASNMNGESEHSPEVKIYGVSGNHDVVTFSFQIPTTDVQGKCLDINENTQITQLGVYYNYKSDGNINAGSHQHPISGDSEMTCSDTETYDTHCENSAQKVCTFDVDLDNP